MSQRYCYQSEGEKPMMGGGWWLILMSVAILWLWKSLAISWLWK